MAVLVEAISVIVRRDAIDSKYRGGWEAFFDAVPNGTLCTDQEIVRIGFMSPSEVEVFIQQLDGMGLRFLEDGKPVDLAIADQQRGLTTACDWLEFGKVSFGPTGQVSACWYFDGPRIAAGVHMRGRSMDLQTPAGWQYEGSLSQSFGFIPTVSGN